MHHITKNQHEFAFKNYYAKLTNDQFAICWPATEPYIKEETPIG